MIMYLLHVCTVEGILSLIGLHMELRYKNSQIVEHMQKKRK